MGEMLFTHFGVSGPLVLTLSSVLATADWPQVQVTLNLKPALTPEQLDARLLRELPPRRASSCKTSCLRFCPRAWRRFSPRYVG